MPSKINRRKKPVVDKKPVVAKKHVVIQATNDENFEHINAYQIVEGFTRCPVAPDGNCFYTATGFFCGLKAPEMRELIMKYFVFKKAEYSIFFETERNFITAVKANSSPRVWNSELCDIAPHATAQALKRDIIIHNYDGKTITQIHTPVDTLALYPPIHLFRSHDHYEILLDNSKTPNKNIYPHPDTSEFMDVIDLTFSDDEKDIEPDIEDETTSDTDVCMIRL
jgi:hypothetical protein